jgi:Tol biopolymer transport system component
MTPFLLRVVLFVTLILLPTPSQGFGKNKIDYTIVRWFSITTEHFDIYFPEGARRIAEFTAGVAEKSLTTIEHDLGYTLERRIPIILYNSHNAFVETNVILDLVDEGVGGFTEFIRNRVVIPYEGPYAQLRHVIHHELTHAVSFDMLTDGAGFPALIGGQVFQPPLWFVEGFAEFESVGWDVEADNILRDAVIEGYLPSIGGIDGGLFAYKGGQSIFRFIAQRYGRKKVGELHAAVRSTHDLEKAMKSTIGLDLDGLNDAWTKDLKRSYWSDLSRRDEITTVAQRLTDHQKERAFLNIGPSFSPDGTTIAFISNRRGSADIYLLNVADGNVLDRLVEGERKADFESLLLLRPGLTWSPNGKALAFIAKSGYRNALYILDVATKRITAKWTFADLDGMFTPSWSPTGDRVVLVGLKDGYSDLYLLHLPTGYLARLTNDPYDEQTPRWSPDGSRIAFSSDRPDGVISSLEDGRPFLYGRYGLFVADLDSSMIILKRVQRVIPGDEQARSPVWSPDGRKLAYISERTGIPTIFVADLDSSFYVAGGGEPVTCNLQPATVHTLPITNLIVGCTQLDWSSDGRKLAFTAFHKGGYDLYLMNDPLSSRTSPDDVRPTPFAEEQRQTRQAIQPDTAVFLQDSVSTLKAYRSKLSPEFFAANAGLSSLFGLHGLAQVALTDLLAHHRLTFATSLNTSLKNSDIFLSYLYLPKRTDYLTTFVHTRNFFFSQEGLTADRIYGLDLALWRPSSRFTRVEVGVTLLRIQREILDPTLFEGFRVGLFGRRLRREGLLVENRHAVLTGMSLVNDTILYGPTGPIDGARSRLTAKYSPSGLRFTVLTLDYRTYLRFLKDYTFAFRVDGGTSFGRNPQRFFLGGVDNTMNPRLAAGRASQEITASEIFLSTFETPLRGTDLFEFKGESVLLINTEIRFPLIRQVIFGRPLPLFIRDVQGVAFFDLGGVRRAGHPFRPVVVENGLPRLNDLTGGIGWGMRVNLGPVILRFDAAWRTDLKTTSRVKYYLSLGPGF